MINKTTITQQSTFAKKPPLYYRLLIRIAQPFYRWWLWYRHQRCANPYYEQEIADRFGQRYHTKQQAPTSLLTSDKLMTDELTSDKLMANDTSNKLAGVNTDFGCIWIHAVSLGEMNTIAPMLRAFLALGFDIYLTNTTHTGHARGRSLFAKEIANGRVRHGFVPIDEPKVIQAFLKQVLPVATLFVETELWANTLYELKRCCIPTFLVNARLSAKSAKRYQTFAKLSQSMMHNLTGIIVQDVLSAQRFRQLGATQTMLAPSLKWQIQDNHRDEHVDFGFLLQTQQTKQAGENVSRPIYVLGSSHAGEEALFLAVHQRLLSDFADALLILVPRHPERFNDVASLLNVSGFTWQRRSNNPKQMIATDIQVYLADSMGELMGFYALADVAVVGGSFVNIGGHNPIEAVQLGVPVIMGAYTQSCQSIVDELRQVGALWQLAIDKTQEQAIEQVTQQLHIWLTEPKQALQAGMSGQALVQSHQHAQQQQMQPILTAIGY